MKQKKYHRIPRATYGGGWLVATRTGNPPKGFQRKEVFEFPTKSDALSFIRDIERNNVEWMLGEARDSK
jgi:hypothetical protein